MFNVFTKILLESRRDCFSEYTEKILERSEIRSGSEMPFTFPRIRYEDNNIDEDEFWEVIKKTKRIQLIGGETWLIKQYVQILEKCVKEAKQKIKRYLHFLITLPP